jgi:hypothetical protein
LNSVLHVQRTAWGAQTHADHDCDDAPHGLLPQEQEEEINKEQPEEELDAEAMMDQMNFQETDGDEYEDKMDEDEGGVNKYCTADIWKDGWAAIAKMKVM